MKNQDIIDDIGEIIKNLYHMVDAEIAEKLFDLRNKIIKRELKEGE
jgi:mevalonate kinase